MGSNHEYTRPTERFRVVQGFNWVTATSTLLCLMASIGHSSTKHVSAFTPMVKPRARCPGGPSLDEKAFQVLPSPTRLSVSAEPPAAEYGTEDLESLRGEDGIYNLVTGDQHRAFLQEHNDKLIVLKVFAPWCRACKGLEPKYQQIANDEKYSDLPILFSSMSIQNNKDYIKSIGVLALPTVQFYKNGKLVDNFPCGPSKVPIMKKKLADLINRSVDPATLTVKVKEEGTAETPLVAAKPAGTPPVADSQQAADAPEHEYLSAEQIHHMRTTIPFFQTLSDIDFDSSLRAAKILTFESGSVLMREGNPGHTFYVILEGEVEICQQTAFKDPMIAPDDYIGTVINRLSPGDYFGERALITGEPRAASIRVTDNLRCVAFHKEDLPPTCILSGISSRFANSTEAEQVSNREFQESINEKYGLSMRELDDLETMRQIKESNLVNQKRGSPNKPQVIVGVDTDDEGVEEFDDQEDEAYALLRTKSASIVPLLEKFKLIRLISRCFDYIVKSGAKWGDPAVRRRRSLLVSRLPRSQREEFVEAFQLVDSNNDGGISLLELQRVMETIGEEKSDGDLREMIPHGYSESAAGEDTMTLQDFIGIMAEVEFYYLFRDVFASLDKRDAGFVKAADLDRVLCGVRDLISDDQHSIIDVEDKEMMIDYEQFTKMLLGLTL